MAESVTNVIAHSCVNDVIMSVVDGIKVGAIRVNKPKSLWDHTTTNENQRSPDKVAKLHTMRKYNKITEIMRKAEKDNIDPSILIENAGFLPEDLEEYQKSRELQLRFKERLKLERKMHDEKEREAQYKREREVARFREEQELAKRRQESMMQYMEHHREQHKKQWMEERIKKQKTEKQKLKKARKFLKQHKAEIPLHLRMEQEFKEKVVLPQLNKEREILDKLKQKCERIDVNKLKQHERSYMQMSKARQREHEQQQQHQINDKDMIQYDVNREAYQRMMQQDRKKQRELAHKSEIAKAKMEARLQYGDSVKTRHKPSIDRQKQEEIERLRMQSEEKQQPKGLKYDEVKELKKQYDQYIRMGKVNHPTSKNMKSQFTKRKEEEARRLEKEKNMKIPDYLHEPKEGNNNHHNKRQQQHTSPPKPKARVKQQQQQVAKMEKTLHKKEISLEKASAGKEQITADTIQDTKDVNEQYMDMIKAKLELLEETTST